MITVTGLRKVYPVKSGEIVALDSIDFSVPRGAIVGVVGPSGAGKSTLVRCLALLDRPTSGSITLNGQNLTELSAGDLRRARQRVGMVFQHDNLLESRTAAANVSYPLEIAGVPRARRKERVAELLGLVGLGDRGDSYPAQLSGGQRQRVGIARALANDPDVLLCDEPTSALDPSTTGEILSLLRDLRDRLGVTTVVITHEMAVVKSLCDHVAVLDAGTITHSGPLLTVVGDQKSGLAAALLPLAVAPGRNAPGSGAPGRGAQGRSAPVLTVTYSAAVSSAAFVTKLARELDIDVDILAASVEQVNGSSLGRLRLGLPEGTDPTAAAGYLSQLGLWVEIG